MKCTYRKTIECKLPSRSINVVQCQLCLAGQQIDSIELLTSAVMDLRINALEEEADAIHKDP